MMMMMMITRTFSESVMLARKIEKLAEDVSHMGKTRNAYLLSKNSIERDVLGYLERTISEYVEWIELVPCGTLV